MFQCECRPDFLKILHLRCCSSCERIVSYASSDLAALQQGGGGLSDTTDKGPWVASGAGIHEINVRRTD